MKKRTKKQRDDNEAQEVNLGDLPVKELLNTKSEMTISRNMKIEGDIKFSTLLRIEGSAIGRIVAPSKACLVMLNGGYFEGDISGISSAYIDGKVVGTVRVAKLTLGTHAYIYGNIFANKIEISRGATLVGQLNVAPSVEINLPGGIDPSMHLVDDQDLLSDNDFESDSDIDGSDIDGKSTTIERIPTPPPKPTIWLLIFEPQVDLYGLDLNLNESNNPIHSLTTFIKNSAKFIDRIFIFLDVHYKITPTQSMFWIRGNFNSINHENRHPSIGEIITKQQILDHEWLPAEDIPPNEATAMIEKAFTIARSEQQSETASIRIIPSHCLIGSSGAAVHPEVQEAVAFWSSAQNQRHTVQHIVSNHTIEQEYESFQEDRPEVEVEVQSQRSPLYNHPTRRIQQCYSLKPLQTIASHDKVIICGRSQSHCQRFSLTNLIQQLLHDSNQENTNDSNGIQDSRRLSTENFFLLQDCMATSSTTPTLIETPRLMPTTNSEVIDEVQTSQVFEELKALGVQSIDSNALIELLKSI